MDGALRLGAARGRRHEPRRGPCSAAAPLADRTIRRRSICACRTGSARAIEAGALKPLDALPGERDIAEAFQVSRVTVRKALSGLVERGLLRQRQGSGTFVASPPQRVEQALSRLTSFTEDMRLRGLAPTVRWLDRGISLASPQEAMRLSLSPNDTVCRLKRLRLAGGVPMAIERATIPTRFLPDPMLVDASLYDVLAARGCTAGESAATPVRRQPRRRRTRRCSTCRPAPRRSPSTACPSSTPARRSSSPNPGIAATPTTSSPS